MKIKKIQGGGPPSRSPSIHASTTVVSKSNSDT